VAGTRTGPATPAVLNRRQPSTFTLRLRVKARRRIQGSAIGHGNVEQNMHDDGSWDKYVSSEQSSATLQEADDAVVGPTGRPLTEFPEPPVLAAHGPARVIAMVNQKGGVGKTTSTINLGAALAEAGRKVLLVDFDPQGALSAGLGANPHELDLTVYNVLMDRKVDVREAIHTTEIENIDLLPANIDLSAAEVQLVNEVAREQVLARALRHVEDEYDVILIDCQPSLGLLTVNALTAAHGVIIPLICEFFALRAVALLMETIEKVQDRLNPRLQLDGVLATMYDARTLHAREVIGRLVEAFGDKVFETVIKRTIKFADATVAAEPITTYAGNHSGADAYRRLAKELIARGGSP
jgi:chromosome partitioning protein